MPSKSSWALAQKRNSRRTHMTLIWINFFLCSLFRWFFFSSIHVYLSTCRSPGSIFRFKVNSNKSGDFFLYSILHSLTRAFFSLSCISRGCLQDEPNSIRHALVCVSVVLLTFLICCAFFTFTSFLHCVPSKEIYGRRCCCVHRIATNLIWI